MFEIDPVRLMYCSTSSSSLAPDGDGSMGSLIVSTLERLLETSKILKYQLYRPWYGGNANSGLLLVICMGIYCPTPTAASAGIQCPSLKAVWFRSIRIQRKE
jgi:hypothetical protein